MNPDDFPNGLLTFKGSPLYEAQFLTIDRILPGCRGGTYRRENIRPACGPCNSETGGSLRSHS